MHMGRVWSFSFGAAQPKLREVPGLQKRRIEDGRVYLTLFPLHWVTILIFDSTIGAGDTLIAGMLFGLTCHFDDWALDRKLTFANELAGRKVVQEGLHDLGKSMQHWL